MASGRRQGQKPIGAAKKQAALTFLTGIKLDGAPVLLPSHRGVQGTHVSANHEPARSKPIEIVQSPVARTLGHQLQAPTARSSSVSESPVKKPETSPEKHVTRTNLALHGVGKRPDTVPPVSPFGAPPLPAGVRLVSSRDAWENDVNFMDVRVVMHQRGSAPFCMFSVMAYDADHNRSKAVDSGAEKSAVRIISRLTGDLSTLEVPIFENFQGLAVSYYRLLVSLIIQPSPDADLSNLPHYRRAHSGPSLTDDDSTLETITVALMKENEANLIAEYQPFSLDDPNLRYGKHCTFLPLQSYAVSFLEYARPSTIKKALNETFREKFPHVQVTLSKLRSLKRDMLTFASEEKISLDLGAVALSYVYFEKLVLLGKINKSNRKYLAAVSLLLAAKFTDASRDTKDIIDVLVDRFRLSRRALLAAEVPVLVALQFSLLVPPEQVEPHYNLLKQPLL